MSLARHQETVKLSPDPTFDYLVEMGLDYEWQHVWLKQGRRSPNDMASGPLMPSVFLGSRGQEGSRRAGFIFSSTEDFPHIIIPDMNEHVTVDSSVAIDHEPDTEEQQECKCSCHDINGENRKRQRQPDIRLVSTNADIIEPKTIQAACDVLGEMFGLDVTGMSKLDILIKVINVLNCTE